jgi:Ca2+-binding RTX toxin-like protein
MNARRTAGFLVAFVTTLVFAFPVAAADPCTIQGTSGNDYWGYVGSNDVYCGGGGNDTVFVNYGRVEGGDGDDQIWMDNFGIFEGGRGNDQVRYAWSGSTFDGGPGDDFLVYNGGSATFLAGPGRSGDPEPWDHRRRSGARHGRR